MYVHSMTDRLTVASSGSANPGRPLSLVAEQTIPAASADHPGGASSSVGGAEGTCRRHVIYAKL